MIFIASALGIVTIVAFALFFILLNNKSGFERQQISVIQSTITAR